MQAVLDQPVLVYLSVALATALILVEIALPTFGVAGALGLGLTVFAVLGINEQQAQWWPLLFVAVALGLWAVMIARKDAPVPQQALAAGFFAGGSIGFAAGAGDTATWVVAVLGIIGLPAGFPSLFAAAERLMDRPPELGMDAYIGRQARVKRWAGTSGTVELDGSLWTATGPADLATDDAVVVTAFDRMTLTVATSPSVTPDSEEE